MVPELPADFSLAHVAAISLLFTSWFIYPVILRNVGRGSLNSQLIIVRQHWISAATRPDSRVCRRPAKTTIVSIWAASPASSGNRAPAV